MKTKSILLLSAVLLSFAVARAEEPFVAAARERGIAVVSHTVPQEFAIGDFDVALDVEKPFDHKVYASYYILTIHDPKRCDVTLKPRRKVLAAGSWATQGQPFYSGSATYEFDLAEITGHAVLETPAAAVRVEAIVDGVSRGAAAFPPYRIDLGDVTGVKKLEIRVTNTLANEFEEFLAPSGLVRGARLLMEK